MAEHLSTHTRHRSLCPNATGSPTARYTPNAAASIPPITFARWATPANNLDHRRLNRPRRTMTARFVLVHLARPGSMGRPVAVSMRRKSGLSSWVQASEGDPLSTSVVLDLSGDWAEYREYLALAGGRDADRRSAA